MDHFDLRLKTLGLLWVAIALFGAGLLLFTTHWGIGTTPDSVVYLTAASNVVDGRGLTGLDGAPLAHHAPFYPLVLSTGSMAGLDGTTMARWLNVLLFVVNIVLVAAISRRLHPSTPWLPLVGALAMLTSQSMLLIHAFAWTEPLFITLMLGSLILLARTTEESRTLVVPAIFASLALFTRYAGITLLLTSVLALLAAPGRTKRGRIEASLYFTMIGATPLLLWMARNKIVGGSATNRTLGIHPIGMQQLSVGLQTIASWLRLPPSTPTWLLALVVGAVAALAATQLRRERPKDALLWLCLLFLPVYALFLAVSISILDANTRLDGRILAPAYVAALIVMLQLLGTGARRAGPLGRLLIGSALTLFLVLSALGSGRWVAESRAAGLGFSSAAWQRSATLSEVRALPPNRPIYSNVPEAVYLHAGREAQPLPRRWQSTLGQENPDFAKEMAELAATLDRSGGWVVYFTSVQPPTFPAEEKLRADLTLRPLVRQADGSIYQR